MASIHTKKVKRLGNSLGIYLPKNKVSPEQEVTFMLFDKKEVAAMIPSKENIEQCLSDKQKKIFKEAFGKPQTLDE